MKEQMTWERADLRAERTLGGDTDSIDSLRAAMLRLGNGATCEECKWQQAVIVVRRRRLLCETCATCDHAYRDVEATAARVQRQRQKRG